MPNSCRHLSELKVLGRASLCIEKVSPGNYQDSRVFEDCSEAEYRVAQAKPAQQSNE